MMQNYGQASTYQRPGSTTRFAGQQAAPPPPPPPPPPGYGAPQGYPPAQWAAPTSTQPPNAWSQSPQQTVGGYYPGTYGAMPGAAQHPMCAPQQHENPPPPPPKPYRLAAAAQHQQNMSFTPQPQQSGYPVQGIPQESYNHAPAQGGRPSSTYGASQGGSYTHAPTAGPQHPSTVVRPNEQQSAYLPPSLPGQGVQAYMPSDANPAPGVYVPPPPDVSASQQAHHGPLQGGMEDFRYTKPTADPASYTQGYQNPQPMQQLQQPPPPPPRIGEQFGQPQHPQSQYGLPGHFSYSSQAQISPQISQTSSTVSPQQQQQVPFRSTGQPQHRPFAQPAPHPSQVQQQPTQPQYSQTLQEQQIPFPAQYPQNHWQSPPPSDSSMINHTAQSSYGSQQSIQQSHWQPGHQVQGSLPTQQNVSGADQNIQAPKPFSRTNTASSNFFSQPSPQSQPVSPISNRPSLSAASGQYQIEPTRTGSVSSLFRASAHAQRTANRTSSPRPPPKLPTPPPPRDDKSKFSVLAAGCPSDWEHFGEGEEIDDEEPSAAKIEEKKSEATQPCSVELPAHVPSPPSTHGWPSPATHPAATDSSEWSESYAPTPPFATSNLSEQHPPQSSQQEFVVQDAVVAPLRTTPKPTQSAHPLAQGSCGIVDSTWDPPNQDTFMKSDFLHQTPPSHQGSVLSDADRTAQSVSQQSNTQQQHQAISVTTGFVIDEGGWNAPQQTPTQSSGVWVAQPKADIPSAAGLSSSNHVGELKAKDEIIDRLRADSERDRDELHAEIERLKAGNQKLKSEFEVAKTHMAGEASTLREQIEAMRTAENQAKADANASAKEHSITVERLKEDLEGKEHNIEERDSTIAELRSQLKEDLEGMEHNIEERDSTIAELRRQLKEDLERKEHSIEDRDSTIAELRRQIETEKTREVPKPATVDLIDIPGIDPWYVQSLDRYIAMLRAEAQEQQIEGKIKIFKAFMKTECGVRGIDYYDTPPQAPVTLPEAVHRPEQAALSRGISNASVRKANLNIEVPQMSTDDEYAYSPGGRPILKRKTTLTPTDGVQEQARAISPVQSTTILTPTSSVDYDSNKTPVQSPPEEQLQPQYKAYVPPASIASDPAQPPLHRHTMSFSGIPTLPSSAGRGNSKGHDEIFFGAHPPEAQKSASRSSSPESLPQNIPVPAPLTFNPRGRTSVAPPLREDRQKTLAGLLPRQSNSGHPSYLINELRIRVQNIGSTSADVDELTKTWEKSASLIRRKRDDARRKRQEENEEHNDDLFNSNEISYAEMKEFEEEFKQEEAKLKAQEGKEEYKSYVEAVFNPIYDGLQADVKALVDLHIEAERLLHSSVSGVKSLGEADVSSTKDCLLVLKDTHEQIEKRHEEVASIVSERDKRYKKTETQPLYAAHNISKMKTVEKQFENAEKQAVLRTKREKADRIARLVDLTEEIVVDAVGTEQTEIDHIIAAIKSLEDTATTDPELLTRARDTLAALKLSSKTLLSLFNALEIDLSNAEIDAEIAQVQAEGADTARQQELEREKQESVRKMEAEFERRVGVLEQDESEIAQLVLRKKRRDGSKSVDEEEEDSEEAEKERRMRMALEEAKRRNGHA
ncbi:hypothetical protein BDW02DRAFT_564796 [Decorospora gaudefroyi]|uniref:Uncharacterized protein n=1 Tax=Decorospora gaudefroyi TaxID=184978 RepID=A0A6A5KTE5_9PLEO|nr:hypothetical protein BDW02DRAFT_564796 [Decorospora gaudefroyi]